MDNQQQNETIQIIWRGKTINSDHHYYILKEYLNGKSLSELSKELGYNICLHELRHTYATKLIANGIDFKTAAYLLGHKVEQTMNTYSHVTNDMISNARNIINQNF